MRTQLLMGVFALITLVLAITAIGRTLGLRVGEAVYLSALILMVALTYLWRRKRG